MQSMNEAFILEIFETKEIAQSKQIHVIKQENLNKM